jgi:hypothetical protein
MAVPTYFLGVAVHEGSHALMAKAFGAELLEFSVVPGLYGPNKNFHFGYTRVLGLQNDRQRTYFWLAPKFVDATLLAAYSALVLTETLPENHYGQLSFAVLASGFWIDFSKDVIAFWPSNDVVKAMNANGYTSEATRWPWRLVYAGLSAASAAVLWRGYQDLFEKEPSQVPFILPLLGASF